MDLEIQKILVNAICTAGGAIVTAIIAAIVNHKKNKTQNDTDVIKNVQESVVALQNTLNVTQNTMQVSQEFTKTQIENLMKTNKSLSEDNVRLKQELFEIKKELNTLRENRCFNITCPHRIKEIPDVKCDHKPINIK